MTSNPHITPDVTLISEHVFANVILNHATDQKSLHAAMPFAAGDVICPFGAGSVYPHAFRLSLQIAEDKHITLVPECLQYTNHSCSPSAFFDTTAMNLVCIKEMQPGDEITFFYPSTEWEMAQPFACDCGSPECLKEIQGAAHLPWAVLEKYRLTDFIKQKKLLSYSSGSEGKEIGDRR